MSAGQLDGKVVWITGAGKGLGKALATAVAQAGATVAATSRTASDLDALAAEVPGVVAYPGSIASTQSVSQIAGAIVADHGRLDGLINCAGISPSFVRSERLDDAVFSEILDVNVTGTFRCARAAAEHMLAAGGGSIVNITSVHAEAGFERIAAYAASKGAVAALTKSLAVEWADRGVRVNAIAPGYYDTDLSHGLLESAWRDRIVGHIPMGRTGEPSELGASGVFLLSDGSGYITGTTLTVDGGWTAW